MDISSNLDNISSGTSLKYKDIQNWTDFCFAYWVQKKGSLSMFCKALEAFIRRKPYISNQIYEILVKKNKIVTKNILRNGL